MTDTDKELIAALVCWAETAGHDRADKAEVLVYRQAAERIRSLVEENERLRLAILGGEDVPGVAASLTLDQVLAAHRDNQSFAESTVSRLSARVRELEGGLEPFAIVADQYDDREDDDFRIWLDHGWTSEITDSFKLVNYRRARSLLQDEGGRASQGRHQPSESGCGAVARTDTDDKFSQGGR